MTTMSPPSLVCLARALIAGEASSDSLRQRENWPEVLGPHRNIGKLGCCLWKGQAAGLLNVLGGRNGEQVSSVC